MTVARRPDFATRIDAAAGGSTEVDEVTFADGSYGPHHGRLVERRRRSDLPVVGRTLFVPHAHATIAITCTAMGTDMATVEDDLTDAESIAATIQLT
jgi:hypothetical protein